MKKQFGYGQMTGHKIVLGLIGLVLALPMGWTDCVPVENNTLPIQLKNALSTETSHYGDPFTAELMNNYCLEGKQLPQGTLIQGVVENGHPSMIFGMPGYVQLQLKQVTLPSGAQTQLTQANKSGLLSDKYHHPQAHTGKQILKASVPFVLLSAAIVVPLRVASGMGTWAAGSIAEGSRMALGAGMKAKHTAPNDTLAKYPIQTRVGYGLLEGAGLTGGYHLLTPSVEPVLSKGSTIHLHLPADKMSVLFSAGEPTKTAVSQSP